MTYNQELNKVIETLDTKKYREFISKYQDVYSKGSLKLLEKYDDEWLYSVMCLMALEITDMPDEIIKKAKEHLDRKGRTYE